VHGAPTHIIESK